MQETHPKFRKSSKEAPSGTGSAALLPSDQSMQQTSRYSFLTGHVIFYLIVWTLIQVADGVITNLAIVTLYASSTEDGLGLIPAQTATILIARAILIPSVEVPFFNKIHRRFGGDRMVHFFVWFAVAVPLFLLATVRIKANTGYSSACYVY